MSTRTDPLPVPGEPTMSRRSVILDACVRAEVHTLLLVSLYLLFAGHNQPGGGFAGGLVASCAFCLRYVAGGERALARSVPVPPPMILGGGLLIAVITGMVPLVGGGEFLESAIWERTLPVFGDVKFTSVLFFDTGVYLVVLGMALLLLEQYGSADGAAVDDELDDGPPTREGGDPAAGAAAETDASGGARPADDGEAGS